MRNIKRILSLLLAAFFSAAALSFAGCNGKVSYDYNKTEYCFGMHQCHVRINGGDYNKAGEEIFRLMADIDRAVSTSLEESPVYKFNNDNAKTSGKKYEIDAIAYEIAMKCKEIYAETNGVFNPAIYPLVEAWGVSSDTLKADKSKGFTLPDDEEIAEYLDYCKYEYLDITEKVVDGQTKYYIAVNEGAPAAAKALKIDFGAYAKGYAADKAVEICKKYKAKYGVINIGGNLIFFGSKPDGKDWYVDLANPFWLKDGLEDEPYFCTFATKECSPVSSGIYERYYSIKNDGKWAGTAENATIFNGDVYVAHIIDPATGIPVNISREHSGNGYTYRNPGGIVNATVLSESSALADAYATVVTVLGMEKGIKFLEDKGLKGIIVTGDGYGDNAEYAVVGGLSIADGSKGTVNEFYKECRVRPGYGFK